MPDLVTRREGAARAAPRREATTVAYVSDQRYYYDSDGRWYTTASLPLPSLIEAFVPRPKEWLFFGRLAPARDPSRLFPIDVPRGVSVEYLGPREPMNGLLGYLLGLPRYRAQVAACVRRAHVVWAKLPFVASFMALHCCRRGALAVTHMVGDPGAALEIRGTMLWRGVASLSRWLSREAQVRADVCMFVSRALRRRYAPRGKEAFVVHEGRLSAHAIAPVRRRDGTEATLIYVGRLAPEKGLDVLLRAVARARGAIPALKLRIVGDGPEKAALSGLVDELALASAVSFAGHVRWGPDLCAELRAATCLVLPSLTEGLPLAVVESLSQATPVIASDVGGVSEVIADGRTGLLVPPGDARALAEAIVRLLSAPALQARLAEEGRREAVCYSLESQVDLLRGVFGRPRLPTVTMGGGR